MDTQKIRQVIIDKLSEMKINPKISLDADNIGDVTFENLGIDSLETTEFALFLEEELGIIIETEDFPMNASIDELAEHIVDLIKHRP
ncbi:MAG: hypothetical protein VR73_02995 [Gammaproteobacteria bacterium BRH_c0]|nr:MAG: hypothetical protein VR73_02995 [Gammaproteobacteria bacterium BRH_c0]